MSNSIAASVARLVVAGLLKPAFSPRIPLAVQRRWVAREAGMTVVVPDYRLAPMHPHPAALEDARAVFDALVRGGTPPARIVLAGDSAGGGLALALCLVLRAAG